MRSRIPFFAVLSVPLLWAGIAACLLYTSTEFLRVMGADAPDREIEGILGVLGFQPVRIDENRGRDESLTAAWECRTVSWRRDVTREIDLVEEVARIYGYDKFPPRMPSSKQPAARLPHARCV